MKCRCSYSSSNPLERTVRSGTTMASRTEFMANIAMQAEDSFVRTSSRWTVIVAPGRILSESV